MDLFDTVRREWPVIRQAPALFLTSLAVLSLCIGSLMYLLFKANLDRKNDLIKTLQDQLSIRSGETAQHKNALARPELRLSMSGGSVFVPNAPDMRSRLTGLALDARVWNTGTPGVATDWVLKVTPKGGEPVVAQLTKIPDRLDLQGPINSTVIHGADELDVRTLRMPISDTPVEGTLLFYVPLDREVVMAGTTRLELTVKDAYGSESGVSQVMGDWVHR
jgi:hypothetical protein